MASRYNRSTRGLASSFGVSRDANRAGYQLRKSIPQKIVKKDANFNDAVSVSTISSTQSFRAKIREDSSESDDDFDFENTVVSGSESKYSHPSILVIFWTEQN